MCEYVEQKTEHGYRVAVLCQVAKNGNVYPEFDDFDACGDTKSYSNSAAALKSVILPGLGQMGKRRVGAGVLILAGEIALGGGAYACYHYGTTPPAGNSPYKYYHYAERYNSLRTMHIACISAAAALYVTNIVSAYTMSPRYKSDNIALVPFLMPTDKSLTTGLGVTLKF